tara:strand:- start:2618 stop:2737 length:120 start_codon:yes stop_codon:yes gene_type:complete
MEGTKKPNKLAFFLEDSKTGKAKPKKKPEQCIERAIFWT